MFKFHDNMYLDISIRDADDIKKSLEDGSPVLNVFLICVRNNGVSLLDIFQSYHLFGRYGQKAAYTVIGIAEGKKRAFKLIEEIMRDYAAEGNDWGQFKKYFLTEG